MFEIFNKIMRVSLNKIKQFHASDLCGINTKVFFYLYFSLFLKMSSSNKDHDIEISKSYFEIVRDDLL